MRIGYLKLGRSWNLDPKNWSAVGGDSDVWRTLHLLATRNPDHEFVLLGRNSGEKPGEVGLPMNVTQFWTEERRTELRERTTPRHSPMTPEEVRNFIAVMDDMTIPYFAGMDGFVCWAGQHGTSNSPIPPVGKMWHEDLTNPQDAFVLYAGYIVRGLSSWRDQDPIGREEVWLCPDVRNYIKCRDLKWPHRHSIMSQFVQRREQKHERYAYGEPPVDTYHVKRIEADHVWVCDTHYTYDRLELSALPEDASVVSLDMDSPRFPFGMVINENRKNVKNPRVQVMLDWVMPFWPNCEIWGQWTSDSLTRLGRTDVRVVPNEHLLTVNSRYRATLTTPASGSGWATSKPWECFLTGTVCFFHPGYDTQGHIIPLKPENAGDDDDLRFLATWLRPPTPQDLKVRVDAVQADDGLWQALALAQRRYVERELIARRWITEIEERTGLRAAVHV